MLICSFCEREYNPDDGHTCAGNSCRPAARRDVSALPSTPPIKANAAAYAGDVLKQMLVSLQDERTAIDADYKAYRALHDPMIASLVDALTKIT